MNNTEIGRRPSMGMYDMISIDDVPQPAMKKTKSRIVWPLPRRYVVCVFAFLNLIVLYSMRLNLSVAVVTMTAYRPKKLDNGTIQQIRDFDWNSENKGHILSSFFYGYLLSELPCAWLSDRLGAATLLGFEVAATSLFTALIPFVAPYGAQAVFLFRALAGVFEGGMLPATESLWARWAPSEERTILMTFTLTGCYVSNIICFPLYGYMATYFGWKSLFYVPAGVGFIWCVIWYANISNDPSDDRKITDLELNYIRRSVGCKCPKQTTYPWKSIFTSMPVWATIVAYFTNRWSYAIVSTTVPTFFNDVWSINVYESGVWLTVPFIVSVFVTPSLGLVADYLRNYKGYSTVKVRCLCHAVGGFGGAIFISFFGFSPNPMYAIIFLTSLQITNSFFYGSFLVNSLDIAPRYASIITAICCSIGGIASLLSPTVAGYIVGNQSKFGWPRVYLLCGIIYTIGTIFYLIFCSGEIQPWARVNQRSEKNTANLDKITTSNEEILMAENNKFTSSHLSINNRVTVC